MDVNDIVGNRYGKLTVIAYYKKIKRHHKYICKCDCGNIIQAYRDNLIANHKTTCANCWKILKEEDYYKYVCTNGKSFIFSSEDLELVSKHRWYIDSHGYPKTNINKATVSLSRLIMNCSDKYYVDHINRNTLDNRRINLRLATAQQNCYNENVRKNNKSGFKGVSFHKNGKYRADIYVNGKNIYLGLFKTPIEAAIAYDESARIYHKEYARLNFPLNEKENSCKE